MIRAKDTHPFVLVASGGERRELRRATPVPRERTYEEEQDRAAEAVAAEMYGEGQEAPAPFELECYVLSDLEGYSPAERKAAAVKLGEFMRFLPGVNLCQWEGLTFTVQRARVMSQSPIMGGYRIRLRLYGPFNDFRDAAGNFIPLA